MAKKNENETPAKDKKTEAEPKPSLLETINWSENTEYIGRTVYTTKGNAVIAGVGKHEDKSYYKLEHKESGEEFVRTQNSVKFKAVDDSYRENYEIDRKIKTASGAPSISCGDLVAEALKGLTLEELATVAKENGLEEKWAKWSENLNPGMRRMNLGNMLRRMENAEDGSVKIFGHPVEKAADLRTKQNNEAAEKAAAAKKAAKAEKNKDLSAKAAKKTGKAKTEETGKAKTEETGKAKTEENATVAA